VRRAPGDTRAAILNAAATEFAARGYDGASVDAIASRSTFNKAMIYYHFGSKHGLYVEVLRDVFRGLGAATTGIADSDLSPADKIGGFLDAFNTMASGHPYMPPIMMREMAEGAARLDADTLELMSRIFLSLQRILEDGVERGAFRPADPVLTYFSLVSPVIFFHASAPVRAALGRQQALPVAGIDDAAFIAHLKSIAVTVLAAGVAPRPTAVAATRGRGSGGPAAKPEATRKSSTRRTRSSRPGDHA